jgi:TPR repeat protein
VAAEQGNLNSRYNLGLLHLDESSSTFSFSKAYDHFKFAALKGHTLSAYDAGVMNYLGLGSYKSCSVS